MINITVHEQDTCTESNKLYLMNTEQQKKNKLEEIRKKRIQDVRQKSKEFAHKLLENVRKETENQMKRIEKTKKDELKIWRQQKLREAQRQQHAVLWDVGDAHKAAETENIEQIEWEAQKQIAATRHNFRNKSKLKITQQNSPNKLVKISTCNIEQSIKKLKKPLGFNNNNEKKNNINNKENYNNSKVHLYPNLHIEEKSELSIISDDVTLTNRKKSVKNLNESAKIMNESVLSAASNHSKNTNSQKCISVPSSYADFKQLQKNGLLKHCHQTRSVVMEVGSSDTSSSSLNITDNHVIDNKMFCRIHSKYLQKNTEYDPKKFQYSVNDGPFQICSSSNPTRFTQISNLIKQKDEQKQPEIDKNIKKIMDINTKLKKNVSSPEKIHNECNKNILQENEINVNPKNIISPRSSPTKKSMTFSNKDQRFLTLEKTQLNKFSYSPQKNNSKKPLSANEIKTINNKKSSLLANKKENDKCIPQKLPNFCSLQKSAIKLQSPVKSLSSKQKWSVDKGCAKTNNSQTISIKAVNPSVSKSIGASTKTIDCQTSRVKFYDYNNKFSKEYDPELRARVTVEDNNVLNCNAMQNAEIEKQLEIDKFEEVKTLRQKSDERCQRALEREKVRRDYENLQAKLDALTVVPGPTQNINDEYLFSEARLNRQTLDKELKINSAVNNILQTPTIITCPEIEEHSTRIKSLFKQLEKSEPIDLNGINVAENINIDALSNSDSCSSILLNYVDNQSKQVKADIDKCGNNYEKGQKLKLILSRINTLKATLLNELKKISNIQQIDSISEMIDSLSHLRKERENIMVVSNEKKDLEIREKHLQKKEQILEKKIRQFYELQQIDKSSKNIRVQLIDDKNDRDDRNEAHYLNERVIVEKEAIKTDPIEILITVKNQNITHKKITQNTGKHKIEKENTKIQDANVRARKQIQSLENSPNDDKSEGSTQYQDLPDTMCNTLNNIVMDKCPSAKEASMRQQMNKIFQETINKKLPVSPIYNNQIRNSSNNELSTYIQRLLGMSRQSIHMLGASTSSVETPSLSIINVADNISHFNNEDTERLDRLQSFINENYSFLSELEESLKTDKCQLSSNDNTKSDIWKKNLKKSSNIETKKNLVLKPILKKPSPPPKSRKTKKLSSTASKRHQIEQDHIKPIALIENCQQKSKINEIKKNLKSNNQTKVLEFERQKNDDFLKNCIESNDDQVQRILELNDMIKRVRNERQKILETNLSPSALNEAGVCSDPTDYLELPNKKITDYSSDSTKISVSPLINDELKQKSSDDKHYKSQDNIYQIIDEDQINLEKNKLTGISRDSGISLSRPLTAQGNCDSPVLDTRRDKLMESYEPLLKNIPKPGKIVLEEVPPCVITSKDEFGDVLLNNKIILPSKKQKPPTTITRYSPAEIAHELSTILEIDTPATFHTNTSEQIEEQQKSIKIVAMDPILEIENPFTESTKVNYENFATFAEYSRDKRLDQPDRVSNTDFTIYHHDSFHLSTKPVKTPLNISERIIQSDVDQLSKSSNSIELADSITRLELSSKKFSTPKEYFEKKANEDNLIEMAEQILESSNSSSVESLMDINNELKRRNLQLIPINDQSVSNQNEIMVNKMKTNFKQDLYELSGIDVLQPTKSKLTELDKDLNSMGMNWASRMLKKNKETQILSSSSISTSSNNNRKQKTPRKCSGKKTSENLVSSSDESDDLSISSYDKLSTNIDLKTFLAEELRKRSSPSNSLSDNSLISLFIKSLVASPKSQKSSISSGRISKDKQHKTSTPKTSDTSIFSSNTKRSSLDTNSIKLFSGESRISSVRLSDSSSDFIKRK